MDWIASKLRKLNDTLNPPCFNCQKPGVAMFGDTGYMVCNDQRCIQAAYQKYQYELGEFMAILLAIDMFWQLIMNNNNTVFK